MSKTEPHSGKHTCPFCKEEFTGWGNNPEPVLPYGSGENVCCDKCNMHEVIPERIKERLIKAGIKKLNEKGYTPS